MDLPLPEASEEDVVAAFYRRRTAAPPPPVAGPALLQLGNVCIRIDDLRASVLRDDFYEFVKEFWDVVSPEEPVWNWHIEFICRDLQVAAENLMEGNPKLYDILANVPPGTSKSTICSIMFPAWAWTRMPTCKFICTSYSHILALDLSLKCRDVVTSEKYTRLFGDIQLREDQNTKGYFVNAFGGSRFCVGTNGTVTGFHGHIIISDDPINPEETTSEAELKKAARFNNVTLSQRKVDKARAFTVTIMQRLHQADPSAILLEKAESGKIKLRHICLPAEIDDSNYRDVRPRGWRQYYKDGLLDEQRLSHTVLREAREHLMEYGYAGQMLQRPVPAGGGTFKIDAFVLEPIAPPLRHFKRLVRYWDKAGTKKGGAYTVGALMGRAPDGRFWVLDVVRGQWEASQREAMIRQTAELDGRQVTVAVEQEPGSGGKESAIGTAQRLAGFRVQLDRPTGDKESRADFFAVQVNGGYVSMLKAEWNKQFLDELQHFPESRYKDQVDASSGAFAVLTRKWLKRGGMW